MIPLPQPDAAVSTWTLGCPRCGRVVTYAQPALIDLVLAGWPDCCGRRMDLDPADAPAADDPVVEGRRTGPPLVPTRRE